MNEKNNKISNGVNKLFFQRTIFSVIAILIFSFFATPIGVLAQATSPAGDSGASPVKSLLQNAGNAAKYDTAKVDGQNPTITLSSVAGGIIKIFLSLLGVIFVVLLIYGGFLWMNARGNAEQVTKSQDLIKDAVIGLIIVVAAYAITYFALFMLAKDYIQNSGF